MIKQWMRTCQECGHIQNATQPTNNKTWEGYRERKCKQCKSISLDYGSLRLIPENDADIKELSESE